MWRSETISLSKRLISQSQVSPTTHPRSPPAFTISPLHTHSHLTPPRPLFPESAQWDNPQPVLWWGGHITLKLAPIPSCTTASTHTLRQEVKKHDSCIRSWGATKSVDKDGYFTCPLSATNSQRSRLRWRSTQQHTLLMKSSACKTHTNWTSVHKSAHSLVKHSRFILAIITYG